MGVQRWLAHMEAERAIGHSVWITGRYLARAGQQDSLVRECTKEETPCILNQVLLKAPK
jgi:hypothetical protein